MFALFVLLLVGGVEGWAQLPSPGEVLEGVGCLNNGEIELQNPQEGWIYGVYRKQANGSFAPVQFNGQKWEIECTGNRTMVFYVDAEGDYTIWYRKPDDRPNTYRDIEPVVLYSVRGYSSLTSIGSNTYCLGDMPNPLVDIMNPEKGVSYTLYKKDSGTGNWGQASLSVFCEGNNQELHLHPNGRAVQGEYKVFAQRDGCTSSPVGGSVTVIDGAGSTTMRCVPGASSPGSSVLCRGMNYTFGVDAGRMTPGVTYNLRRNGAVIQTITYVRGSTTYFKAVSEPGEYTIDSDAPCQQVTGSFIIGESTVPNVALKEVGEVCADPDLGYSIEVVDYDPDAVYTLWRDGVNTRTTSATQYPFRVTVAAGDAAGHTYTVSAVKNGCEAPRISGNDIKVVPQPSASDLTLNITQDATDKCKYVLTIVGTTNANVDYVIYALDEDNNHVNVSTKKGNGGTLSFEPKTSEVGKTIKYYAYAKIGSGTCRSTIGPVSGVELPGRPEKPEVDKSIFRYCGTATGAEVVLPGPPADGVEYYTLYGGDAPLRSLAGAGNITFSNVPAGTYYVKATNNEGCESIDRSNVIDVRQYERYPIISGLNTEESYCSNDNEVYDVIIDYEQGPDDIDEYDFTLEVNGKEVDKALKLTVASSDNHGKPKSYKFSFSLPDYGLNRASGDIDIKVKTKNAAIGCTESKLTINILQVPGKPVVTPGRYDICEGTTFRFEAKAAGTMDDPHYFYYSDEALTTLVNNENDETHGSIFEGEALIPADARDNDARLETDAQGNQYYVQKYYVVAQDGAQKTCRSEVQEVVVRIQKNNAKALYEQGPETAICQDSEPLALSSFFSPSNGDYYILGTVNGLRAELKITTTNAAGVVALNPDVFTPGGIKSEYLTNAKVLDNEFKEVENPTAFVPLNNSQNGAQNFVYTVVFRSKSCPTTFTAQLGFTVNKKWEQAQYQINADDCYCTNDPITITGSPNVFTEYQGKTYGWGKLKVDGVIYEDMPFTDNKDYTYTFYPTLRHRGNANGKKVQLSYEYMDGSTGCVYTVYKQTTLFQPVEDEVFFEYAGMPEGFQAGFSEDYERLCPTNSDPLKLIPYVYEYQYQDDGSGNLHLTVDSYTNFNGKIPYTSSKGVNDGKEIVINRDEVALVTDRDKQVTVNAAYNRIDNEKVEFTGTVDADRTVTFTTPWGTKHTFGCGSAEVDAKVIIKAEFSRSPRPDTDPVQYAIIERFNISIDAYYTFGTVNIPASDIFKTVAVGNGGKKVVINTDNLPAEYKGRVVPYKTKKELTTYTDKTAEDTYYYEFSGAGVVPFDEDGRPVNDLKYHYYDYTNSLGKGEYYIDPVTGLKTSDSRGERHDVDIAGSGKDVAYYVFIPAIIGNGNSTNITLSVDNGANCRDRSACSARYSRPLTIKRDLEWNLPSSTCGQRTDNDNYINVLINYPSRQLEDVPANAALIYKDGARPSQFYAVDQIRTYDYGYEGLEGTSSITVRKITNYATADGSIANPYVFSTPLAYTIGDATKTATPHVNYDINGIGHLDFPSLEKEQSQKVATDEDYGVTSFQWIFDNGPTAEGYYLFDWVYTSPSGCELRKQKVVYIYTKSEPFSIYYGTTATDVAATVWPAYPTHKPTDAETTAHPELAKQLDGWYNADGSLKWDSEVAVELCWNKVIYQQEHDKSNIISFWPDNTLKSLLTGEPSAPGVFYIQRTKNADNTSNSIPSYNEVDDPRFHCVKISSENFPNDYINNYSLYTTSLEPNVEYRVLYYMGDGCGDPWSRRIILKNEGSVTYDLGDKLCTTTLTKDANGLTVSKYFGKEMFHAIGTNYEGKFSISPVPMVKENGSDVLVPFLDWTAGEYDDFAENKKGQRFYLDIEKLINSGYVSDQTNFTVYYEYEVGSCVFRAPQSFTLYNLTTPQFAVTHENDVNTDVRVFCQSEAEKYVLRGHGPKKPNTSDDSDFIKGSGYYEVKLLGSADNVLNHGLMFKKNDGTWIESGVLTDGTLTDADGTFYFNPTTLSPGVYIVNYIFKSDAATFGSECVNTDQKQYLVVPKHNAYPAVEVEYCPYYLDGDGVLLDNWANNTNTTSSDVITANHLNIPVQNLVQKSYGYYKYTISNGSDSKSFYDLYIKDANGQDDVLFPAGDGRTLQLTIDNLKTADNNENLTNKITQTTNVNDGWVVKSSLPVYYQYSANKKEIFVLTHEDEDGKYHEKITDTNGEVQFEIGGKKLKELYGRTVTFEQSKIVTEDCETIVKKIVPKKYADYKFEFDVNPTCADDKTGSVVLTHLYRGTDVSGNPIEVPISTSYSYMWFEDKDKNGNITTKTGASESIATTSPDPYKLINVDKGNYILMISETGGGKCPFISLPQTVEKINPINFHVDVTQRYVCDYDETTGRAGTAGSAEIRLDGGNTSSIDNAVAVWRDGNGREIEGTHGMFSISGLKAGKYFATVYSANDEKCAYTLEFEIRNLPEPTFNIVTTPALCKGENNGTATIEVTFKASETDEEKVYMLGESQTDKSTLYTKYNKFDPALQFKITQGVSTDMEYTAPGWGVLSDFATAKAYDFGELKVNVKSAQKTVSPDKYTVDGQKLVTYTIEIGKNTVAGTSGLKGTSELKATNAPNYSVYVRYGKLEGEYPKCLYVEPFRVDEPDDYVEIKQLAIDDVSWNGSNDC